MPRTNDEILKLFKQVSKNNLVDIIGGTQTMDQWIQDVKYVAYNRKTKPEIMVLLLEKKKEAYTGELYISRSDFDNDGR